MDNQYRIDIGELLATVRKAEVIVVRFVTVQHRLLADFRHGEADPPLLKVVPRAASAQDRFKSIKLLRPRFRLPKKISAVWWPRYIESLVDAGIWDAIVQRVIDEGFPVAAECDGILDELRTMERSELANAIAGDGYRTLWPVTSQR